MRPNLHDHKIEVETYLSIEYNLAKKLYSNGEIVSISQVILRDIRQLVCIINEISNPPPFIDTENLPITIPNNASHISSKERHLQQIIDNMH